MASVLTFPSRVPNMLAPGTTEETRRTSDIAPRPHGELVRLVDGLHGGEAWAERELLQRFTSHVERVLYRVLGSTRDIDDLTQEVFLRVLSKLDALVEPTALPGFVTSIAVFVAREQLRARRRKRWLVFVAPEELPDTSVAAPQADARRAMDAFYRVLRALDEDVHLFLALRWLEQMELTEIAAATRASLATVKRRIAKGEQVFREKACLEPELAAWVKESS